MTIDIQIEGRANMEASTYELRGSLDGREWTEWLTIGAQQTMHLDTGDVLIEGRMTQEACELRVSTDGGKRWNEWHTLRPQQTMHVDVR